MMKKLSPSGKSHVTHWFKKSQKIVILLEQIHSSQAEAESAVGDFGVDFPIPTYHLDAPGRKTVLKGGKEKPVGVLEQLDGEDGVFDAEVGTEAESEGEYVDVLVLLTLLRFPGFSSRASCFPILSVEKDLRERLGLRVLLTPLDLQIVSF